ncbi:hypothetical protein DRO58_05615 [Candidatus Bathyarchaeota archaeon]|nr:MAG: hypothetical protein DRO58_05615 [Candidatus Bathyarchaeota archaeon]
MKNYIREMPLEWLGKPHYCPACDRKLVLLGYGYEQSIRVVNWLCQNCKIQYRVRIPKKHMPPDYACNVCARACMRASP